MMNRYIKDLQPLFSIMLIVVGGYIIVYGGTFIIEAMVELCKGMYSTGRYLGVFLGSFFS